MISPESHVFSELFSGCKRMLSYSPVHTDCDNGNDNGNGRMGYIGLYGSVHMETCGKGNINP